MADGAAVDFAAFDSEVLEVLAPHERIMKMAVAEVLVFIDAGIGFGRFEILLRAAKDDGVLVEQKSDIAFNVDGGRRINSRPERLPGSRRRNRFALFNGFVDGGSIVGHAIANRARNFSRRMWQWKTRAVENWAP